MFKNFSFPGLLLLAALAFLGAPSEPLAASDCGELGTVVCSQTTKCTGFWFWKKCGSPSNSYYDAL